LVSLLSCLPTGFVNGMGYIPPPPLPAPPSFPTPTNSPCPLRPHAPAEFYYCWLIVVFYPSLVDCCFYRLPSPLPTAYPLTLCWKQSITTAWYAQFLHFPLMPRKLHGNVLIHWISTWYSWMGCVNMWGGLPEWKTRSARPCEASKVLEAQKMCMRCSFNYRGQRRNM
jgi:hypothetical protein